MFKFLDQTLGMILHISLILFLSGIYINFGIVNIFAIILACLTSLFLPSASIFIHEIGRAIGIKIAGYRIYGVQIGSWVFDLKSVKSRRCNDLKLINENIIGDYVLFLPKHKNWADWKDKLISYSGPTFLGFVIICILYVALNNLSPDMFNPRDDLGVNANIFIFFMTIVKSDSAIWFAIAISQAIVVLTSLKLIEDADFSEPYWTQSHWALRWLFFDSDYGFDLPNEEFTHVKTIIKNEVDNEADDDLPLLLAMAAWRRTLPALFVQTMEESNIDIKSFTPELLSALIPEYTACLVLTGKTNISIFREFERLDDTKLKSSSIFWLAKSLLDYSRGQYANAIKAAKTSEGLILNNGNNIPEAEVRIFTAIRNKQSLPVFT